MLTTEDKAAVANDLVSDETLATIALEAAAQIHGGDAPGALKRFADAKISNDLRKLLVAAD